MTAAHALEARGLCFARGRTTILADISLAARPGAIHAVIGPNGSGKTTLLRLLAGILCPCAGTVELLERPLGVYSHRQRARAVAYLPQSLPGTLPLTVRELVLLGRTAHQGLLGLETSSDREAVGRALDLARVAHLADARLERLSGGELQRAFIAKALCQEPAVLLLDEPTASLDPAHALQVIELLAGLRKAHAVCTVLASHDLNLAARYADEATLLHGGRVVCQGAPAMVFSPQRLEPVYGCGFELCQSSSGAGVLLPFSNENIPRRD
ncbi:MAG: ABC transporter ATP-binding protein [Desulfovibrio sp.]|jgi:iron complex transport system ATP-binding protein|nr:ABC transporter ATP-binding protein [Desulfovibrio sp.]